MSEFVPEVEKTTTEFDGQAEVEITTNWDEVSTTFDSMDLKEDLLRGIYAYGFEKPSAIQQVTINFVCSRIISLLQSESISCHFFISFPPSPSFSCRDFREPSSR